MKIMIESNAKLALSYESVCRRSQKYSVPVCGNGDIDHYVKVLSHQLIVSDETI
jgi:tRNA-dihydrouridine synthase